MIQQQQHQSPPLQQQKSPRDSSDGQIPLQAISSPAGAAASKRPSRSCTSLFSSPTVSAKADEPKRDSCSKSTADVKMTTTTSQKASLKARKRKIGDLEAKEVLIQSNIDELRKECGRLKTKLSKVEATAEELLAKGEGDCNSSSAVIKFPIRDEQLLALAHRGTLPPLKPVPPAALQLRMMLPPFADADDALAVWDFLNVFSKTLSLVHPIRWSSFVDLLTYSSKDSLALQDLFCSLLHLILSDAAAVAKLNAALIPVRRVHFACRARREATRPTSSSSDREELLLFNREELLREDDFDLSYNGLKLLPPHKLTPAAASVDVLQMQATLRSVLLRLEPVRQLRRAVLDVGTVMHRAYVEEESANRTKRPAVPEDLNTLVGLMRAFKQPITAASISTPNCTNQSVVPNTSGSTIAVASPTTTAAAAVRVSSQLRAISSEVMASINDDAASSKPCSSSSRSRLGWAPIDKDAVFEVTSSVTSRWSSVVEVARLLECFELHQLGAGHKVGLLRMLVDACYDTQRIKRILESNAEERAVQIQHMNKQQREMKAKLREASMTKKDLALAQCRRINRAAADKEEARLAALEKKGSGRKKKKPPTGPGAGKGKSSAKGATGCKDGLDPSPEQLSAMIDELVVLEAVGVDVVEDIVVEEVISDDDHESESEAAAAALVDGSNDDGDDHEFEYDRSGNLLQRTKRSRRMTAQAKSKSLDRRRANEMRRAKQCQINAAEARLAKAVGSSSEREVRAALKQAEKAGCRGVTADGKVFCTSLMKQVYLRLNALETQAKEDLATSKYDRALQEHFVRSMPLGADRHGSQYWNFTGDESLVFVQRFAAPTAAAATEIVSTKLAPPLTSSSSSSDIQEKGSSALSHLHRSRPGRHRYEWGVYSTAGELWQLWDSLDERAEREGALKASIKARFCDLQEPEQVYQSFGSEYIGRKVSRTFGRRKAVIGLIVGWLPAVEGEVALWHVHHMDGDEEDLEEAELLSSLIGTNTTTATNTTNQACLDESTSSGNEQIHRSSIQSSSEGVTGPSMDLPLIHTEEVDEPSVIRGSNGLCRGVPAWRCPPLTTSCGLHLLRTEFLRVFASMADELKRRGALSREDRRAWEAAFRDDDASNDVCALASALLRLEEVVRTLQVAEDKHDDQEALLAKLAERKKMSEEGWQFDTTNTNDSRIGKKARRFFKGFGRSDGVIVGFLPAEKNDGTALYHMEHWDGDEEDLNDSEAMQAIQMFEQDAAEDAHDDDDNSSVGVSEDTAADSQCGSESDYGGGHGRDALISCSEDGSTLWPTAEVRLRWQSSVAAIRTVSEAALALRSFAQQLSLFGLIPDLPTAKYNAAPSTGRTTSKSKHQLLSPLKSSSSHGAGARQRLSRVATTRRRVGSYTD